MSASWIGRSIAAVALALAAGACGDSVGPETFPETFEEAIDHDIAVLAADATLEDVAMWNQQLAFGPQPAPGLRSAPGRPGGHWEWSGEFSGTRDVTFLDADGVEQDAYDALTTDVIHILHEIQGERSREGWTVSVHRLRDMTVSGLAGTETHRTWNGTGGEEVSRSGINLDGEERSYEAVGTFTYDDVVVPVPGSTPRYPLSGTITRTLNVTVTGPSGTRTRSVEVVITFDGDSTATAVVNGVTREIDLTTREGRNPLRDRRP